MSTSIRFGLKAIVARGTLTIDGSKHQLSREFSARVESAGELDRRITATRLLTTGVIALAWRKKKDTRTLYLVISGPGCMEYIELKPTQNKEAQQFAHKFNAYTAGLAEAAVQ